MRLFLLGQGAIASRFIAQLGSAELANVELIGGVLDAESIRRGLEAGSRSTKNLLPLGAERPDEELLLRQLRASAPDVVLSIQYPWILSGDLLNAWGSGILNLHNAKLPDYRGHHCLSHEIANDERIHTSTLHWIEPAVDRGRLLAEREIGILADDTAHRLWQRSLDSCHELLMEVFAGTKPLPQESECPPIAGGGRFYSLSEIERLKRIETTDADTIFRVARACWFPPHEPAYLEVAGSRLYVLPFSPRYEITLEAHDPGDRPPS